MPVSGFEKLRGNQAISININTIDPSNNMKTVIEADDEKIETNAH
jgi:hypothetical protein